ncbi:polysaccharide pyruvyl transferase family protein [Kocuria sabuli]|uniref:polysaccharide pyruvyl transferase family protein n=1 Tax=Kocuria sabuli TaxID=3071448 RepID=UPI0034D5D454
MPRRVFVSLVAQSENLGDLVIRKNGIKGAFPGQPVVALTTGMPESFMQAFELGKDLKCVDSLVRFQWLLFRSSLFRRAHLLIAPGPVVLSNKPSRLLKSAVLICNSALVRMGGGSVMSIGRSYRATGGPSQRLERIQRKLATTYFVRDRESLSVVGSSVEVLPDLAFIGKQNVHERPRDLISVSVRDAGPETRDLLGSLIRFAENNSLQVVFVTQVKFDEPLHNELASFFGVPHVSWGDKSHAEQLHDVAKAYSRSVAVVSNRLHALIFGLQGGAAAIPVDANKHPKLLSTLSGLMPFCSLRDFLSGWSDGLSKLEIMRRESVASWTRAQQLLVGALEKS